MLILPADRLPTAQPLDRPLRGRAPERTRPRSVLDQLRIASAEPIDDPRICRPAIRGQLLLFRPHRQLTDTHARRIRHRDLAGYDRLRETAIAFAAERGLSTAWWRGTCLMLRLALALRDADGDDHIPEETLDDLPRFRNAVADVLRHAGMLRPRHSTRSAVLHNPQRSCKYCDCWGVRAICEGCSSWKHRNHPVGDCVRCGREAVPLLGGLCRACGLHIDQHGSHARTQTWTQLWFGGEFAPRLAMRTGTLGYVAPQQKARARAAARRPPAPPISPHLAVPGQTVLFDARRDWRCIAAGTLGKLPSLTPAAQALLTEFRQHTQAQGWDEEVRRLAARSLWIVLAWIGADLRTGEQVRYLFMDHGKLLSLFYLFDTPIQQACKATGLVVPGGRGGQGRGTVTAHRFRHTVGTQLAERGAKLHTIMKVLGHSSVSMALIYAQISDQEVLRDYQAVLAPGAVIAGPAALDLKSGVLPDEAVHWLKANFFKTELELGHCLRLPAEGPCECDLYLTCAKFVTTPEYAPRLKARLDIEQQLVQDADERGWTREAERHTAIARRLRGLLTDLEEQAGPGDTPRREPGPCTSTD